MHSYASYKTKQNTAVSVQCSSLIPFVDELT